MDVNTTLKSFILNFVLIIIHIFKNLIPVLSIAVQELTGFLYFKVIGRAHSHKALDIFSWLDKWLNGEISLLNEVIFMRSSSFHSAVKFPITLTNSGLSASFSNLILNHCSSSSWLGCVANGLIWIGSQLGRRAGLQHAIDRSIAWTLPFLWVSLEMLP
jgi:hypothetical protein